MKVNLNKLALASGIALIFMSPAYAEDLMAVYRLAQLNDPTVLSARYQLEGVNQKIPQARANLLPVITANGLDSHTLAKTAFNNIPDIPELDTPAIPSRGIGMCKLPNLCFAPKMSTPTKNRN